MPQRLVVQARFNRSISYTRRAVPPMAPLSNGYFVMPSPPQNHYPGTTDSAIWRMRAAVAGMNELRCKLAVLEGKLERLGSRVNDLHARVEEFGKELRKSGARRRRLSVSKNVGIDGRVVVKVGNELDGDDWVQIEETVETRDGDNGSLREKKEAAGMERLKESKANPGTATIVKNRSGEVVDILI